VLFSWQLGNATVYPLGSPQFIALMLENKIIDSEDSVVQKHLFAFLLDM